MGKANPRSRASQSNRFGSACVSKKVLAIGPRGCQLPCRRVAGLLILVACFIFLVPTFAAGQDVSARISSREAWVGSPIVLQLQIRNAENYSPPNDIEIDGCDVRSAGAPSQSSQITIINGRRSESRSVTMQYLITPQREGRFQIPELEIEVNRETRKTRPISFVATKSETGDLLFVEVEGDKDSVFVGQPLDIKLKIWVKPYTDRENNIKLNEGHMWQLLSKQTTWGVFTDRMKELSENRQRPGGESVLRNDEEGQSREYYLYETNGTIYPTKPGKIDASDLQVVVNYPLSLGRRRDPFDSFFEDNGFGSSSLMRDMMGSSFGRSLTVNNSRPVVAEASVNSTEVIPVPAEGQPADYRGAVGKYEIVADAEPRNVTAGDPITLRLGILGDGPMELVQAPPLHQIKSLTDNFQVTDQSLAGFVQDDTKVFITTIRPTSEEVIQIPPIPFSFFDPDRKEYQTVYSKPIDIEVEKAESLQMDAIVSNTASAVPKESAGDKGGSFNLPDEISGWATALQHLWYIVLVPPACIALFFLCKLALAIPTIVSKIKSPVSNARQGIARAEQESDLVTALQQFVADLTRTECPTFEHAVGQMRAVRDYETAGRMEQFHNRISRMTSWTNEYVTEQPGQDLSSLKAESSDLLAGIELAWRNRRIQKNMRT